MSKMTTWMVLTILRLVIAIVVGWNMLQRVQYELMRVLRIFRFTIPR